MFGAEVGGASAIEHVVVLSRSGSGASALEPQPASATVPALLAMSFNSYRDPAAAVQTSARIAEGAQCWTLDVGDVDDAARSLHELLTAPATSSG